MSRQIERADSQRRVQVFFHAKDAAIVKANAFENAVAVKQAVIEDRNLGVGLVEKFSVDVDLQRFRWPRLSSRLSAAESDFDRGRRDGGGFSVFG